MGGMEVNGMGKAEQAGPEEAKGAAVARGGLGGSNLMEVFKFTGTAYAAGDVIEEEDRLEVEVEGMGGGALQGVKEAGVSTVKEGEEEGGSRVVEG